MEKNLEQEKVLKQLKCSYEMYEKTKKETASVLKSRIDENGNRMYSDEKIEEELKLINESQNDIVAQYEQCGGNPDDLVKKKKKKHAQSEENIQNEFKKMVNDFEDDRKEALNKEISATATRLEQEYIPAKGSYNPTEAFDVIPLPSKGEGYKDKIAKMSVAYLTAYDENMIVSPNLYRDNLIIDYILQEKVLSKEIEPIDLLEGDRDAILLFLRASGYGNEYPITATDDATGKEFDTVIDLSKLKYKEFNLKGDSNGWFPYTLPVSGREIKFRFPTHRDTVMLEKMEKAENKKTKKDVIKSYMSTIETFLDSDDDIKKDDKVKVRQSINAINNWADNIENEDDIKFNHTLTNRLNLLVMAVDGITDRKYIMDFIKKMNVRDSSSLRKYIAQNEPGIDYNISVERPESLGGGSFSTFLQLDQFLFLNISD